MNGIRWHGTASNCVVVKKVVMSPTVLKKEAGDFVKNLITADRPISRQPTNSVDSLVTLRAECQIKVSYSAIS